MACAGYVKQACFLTSTSVMLNGTLKVQKTVQDAQITRIQIVWCSDRTAEHHRPD